MSLRVFLLHAGLARGSGVSRTCGWAKEQVDWPFAARDKMCLPVGLPDRVHLGLQSCAALCAICSNCVAYVLVMTWIYKTCRRLVGTVFFPRAGLLSPPLQGLDQTYSSFKTVGRPQEVQSYQSLRPSTGIRLEGRAYVSFLLCQEVMPAPYSVSFSVPNNTFQSKSYVHQLVCC